MLNIYRCERCEGCGYITGGFRWETPWIRCVPAEPAGAGMAAGLLEAHACPDCGGTGALIELESARTEPALPSRHGIPPRNRYVHHVSRVLHMQAAQRAG
jgi:hypothetical protein